MPKIKTRRAAAKRFELTGSGKYKRRRQNLRHILTKKAPGRKMRLGQPATRQMKRLLKGCCPTARIHGRKTESVL